MFYHAFSGEALVQLAGFRPSAGIAVTGSETLLGGKIFFWRGEKGVL